MWSCLEIWKSFLKFSSSFIFWALYRNGDGGLLLTILGCSTILFSFSSFTSSISGVGLVFYLGEGDGFLKFSRTTDQLYGCLKFSRPFDHWYLFLFKGSKYDNSTLASWTFYLWGGSTNSLSFLNVIVVISFWLFFVSLGNSPVDLTNYDEASYPTWGSSLWIDFCISFTIWVCCPGNCFIVSSK